MEITQESVLNAINSTGILYALLVIGFLLAFIAFKLQDQKQGKK